MTREIVRALENELLQKLKESEPQQAEIVIALLEKIKLPGLALQVQQNFPGFSPALRVGGSIQSGEKALEDRSGNAMVFIASVDLSQIKSISTIPQTGRVEIFAAADISSRPVKDGRAFKIIHREDDEKTAYLHGTLYQASPVWTVDEKAETLAGAVGIDESLSRYLGQWAAKFNRANLQGDTFMHVADRLDLSEQKEICAFASGGISYSAARAADRHYSHLVGEASDWMLFLQIARTEVGPLRLLIKKADLAAGHFERGWLILLNNRSD